MRDSDLLGGFQQGIKMPDVRMHASVRDETKEMEPSVPFFSALEGFEDVFVFVELALFDGNVDPDNILPDYTTSTNVEVTL